LLTIAYSLRYSLYIFLQAPLVRVKGFLVYDNIYFIVLPIAFLIFLSIFGGFYFFEFIFSLLILLIVTSG